MTAKLLSRENLLTLVTLKVKTISFGMEHCLVLDHVGNMYSWGCGASGCLGHDDYQSYTQPKKIICDSKIALIEAGGYHNGAINSKGKLLMWGRSDAGQLGFPQGKLSFERNGFVIKKPTLVQYFYEIQVTQIALGEAHTIVLDKTGKVYSFGWNALGQLGVKAKTNGLPSFEITVLKFSESNPVQQISAGSVYSLALTQNGQLYVWGSGQQGQLGLGNDQTILNSFMDYPVLIDYLKDENIKEVICGETYSIAKSLDGKIYAWGQGKATSTEVVNNQSNSNKISTPIDVISYFPKELGSIEVIHPFLIHSEEEPVFSDEPTKRIIIGSPDNYSIGEETDERLSSTKPITDHALEVMARESGNKVVIKQFSTNPRNLAINIEPIMILNQVRDSQYDDSDRRSTSPEIPSEKEGDFDFDEPPESSRVMDDD